MPKKTTRTRRGTTKTAPTKVGGGGFPSRPPELFPEAPPGFFPADKLAQSDVEAGKEEGKIQRIPFLEALPEALGGPAWKRFFKKHAGRDLDSARNVVELRGLFPAFLTGESIEVPDGWTAVYRIVTVGRDELGLELHAMHHDAYVASFSSVVAPREPLEKDEQALKMVTAAVIAGAARALRVIAATQGVKLPRDLERYKPRPRDYHKEIASRHGANLRGAPLFHEVDWSPAAAVDPNDDLFG